ncbi:MAG: DUF58 domain-containing protein [Aquificae bacterium]|nr:DUF58 domain-containing protein [Aquificota bacterium]
MVDKSRIITIKIKQKVLSLIEGRHQVLKFGEEDDLKNIREYTYGDNVKRINWIITAKEKKPYVVEREELKSQNIIVCLFVDQEFLFKNKLDKLIEVYGIIGYSALYQRDRLFTYIFGEGLEKEYKHRNLPSTVDQVIREIYSMDLKNKRLDLTDLEGVLAKHKRSLVVLIGDFFYRVNLLKIASKHKVKIIKIRDRDEENPENYTGYQLKSFDGKKKIPYLVKPMVKTYRSNLQKIERYLRQQIVLKKIPSKTIYTHEEPLVKLKTLFS